MYEGFWDLYCKKPVSTNDIPTKKLEGFISRVKLITGPSDITEDDGSINKSVANLPLKAMVRIRIPLNRPAPVAEMRDDEDPSDGGDGTNRSPPDETHHSGMPSSREHQQLSTHPDEDTSAFTEQPVEDRVLFINPVREATNSRIWVLHQAASRSLRKDMATVLKKSIKELDALEQEDFLNAVEAHAVEAEKALVKIFSSEEPAVCEQFQALRQKYLGGSGAPIPTFDFELN